MNLYNKFKEYIYTKVDDQSTVADAIEDTTHANNPSGAATEILPGRGQKRIREVESVEAEGDSRSKHQRSGHEKRLEGDFEVGKDAVLLEVPKPFHDRDWRPPEHNTMPGTSFRMVNTLDKSTPQAATKRANGSSFSSHIPSNFNPHARGPPTLSTTVSAGQNVRKRRSFPDLQAGDEMVSGSTHKKQKLRSGSKAQETIDLTHGNERFGEPMGVQRNDAILAPQNVTAINHATKARPYDAFSAGEIKAAGFGKKSGNARRNAARRNSGSQRSRDPSQCSVHESLERASSSRHGDTAHMLDVEQHQASRDHDLTTPVIHLTKGFEDIQGRVPPKRAGKQGDPNDMQDLGKAFGHARSNAISKRSTNNPPQSERRLANEFKRDNSDQRVAAGPKMSKSVRSRASHSGDGGSSPDMLNGGTTMPSPTSRNRSPTKQVTAAGASMSNARAAPAVEQSSLRVRGDDEGIQINSIYSKQCVQTAKNLSLVWDAQEEAYFVHDGSKYVCLPHRRELVTIGRKDVNKWHGSSNSTKVMLRGPSTTWSTGTILIDFFDDDGMSDFYHHLSSADNLTTDLTKSADDLGKIFAKQSQVAEAEHDKLCRQSVGTYSGLPQRRTEDRRTNTEEAAYGKGFTTRRSAPENTLNTHERERSIQPASGTTSKFFDGDGDGDGVEPVRKSSRVSRAPASKPKSPTPQPPPKWTDENALPVWPSMVYPAKGLRRVTVERTDIERLDEGDYLNDNLVSFAMRHIEENMDPKHKDKVYFFNTFFYTTLNRKKGKSRLDYEAVKRWTKSGVVDLFDKDYVVVPINLNFHWFVAIICNLPNLPRTPIDSDGETEPKGKGQMLESTPRRPMSSGSHSAGPKAAAGAEPDNIQYLSDSDDKSRNSNEFEFTDDLKVVESSAFTNDVLESRGASSKKSSMKSKPAPATRKYDVNQPSIITLDSFGSARSPEIRVLKEYITAEAREKRRMQIDISQLQGVTAKGIPLQPNYCDCGVFAIGYLKEFAKDPDQFVHDILRKEMKEEVFSDFSAPETRNEIRANILTLGQEQWEERKLQKKAKQQNKSKALPPRAAEPMAPSSQPASSALPNPKSSPPQGMQSSTAVEPATTPCRPPAQTVLARHVEADDDEMRVSPPKTLAVPQIRPTLVAPPTNDDEDDDMLDRPEEMSSTAPTALLRVTHSDPAATDSRPEHSLLDEFKKHIKSEADAAAHQTAAAAAQYVQSAIDGRSDPEPEIAESQEYNGVQVWQGTRSTFSDD